MTAKKKRIFDHDRRMELRLRLAAKKAGKPVLSGSQGGLIIELPEKDLLDRLINRVRRL